MKSTSYAYEYRTRRVQPILRRLWGSGGNRLTPLSIWLNRCITRFCSYCLFRLPPPPRFTRHRRRFSYGPFCFSFGTKVKISPCHRLVACSGLSILILPFEDSRPPRVQGPKALVVSRGIWEVQEGTKGGHRNPPCSLLRSRFLTILKFISKEKKTFQTNNPFPSSHTVTLSLPTSLEQYSALSA